MSGIVLDKEMLGKPKEKFWVLYVKKRIKENKNFLGFVSGQTGSGKSWSCLRIAEEMDQDFNSDRIVFSGLELMQLINSNTLKKGSVIVFEEAGIGMSSKNWQSTINKMLNFLVQTFRHRNFILLFNSPYMDFVDASTRKLFHAEFTTVGINHKNKQCKLKPLLIQYNSKARKFYFKMLRVITNKGVIPIKFWNVDKPSDDLIRQYEIKKREFTDKLNQTIQEELQNIETSKDKIKSNELTLNQEEVLELLKDKHTIKEIANKLDVSINRIYGIMNSIKKKGYKIRAIRTGKHKTIVKHYEVIEI